MSNINTIIFDIGKVLIDYDWKAFILENFNNNEELADRMYDAMYCHGVWDEIDRGVWTKDELIQGFLKYTPDLENELRRYLEISPFALKQFDFTKNWLRELKARGFQLLYLSNYSYHMRYTNPECLDFMPIMDGGIYSCDVKLIKPDHKIFELLMKRYSLIPENCVFLDDKPANVEAARALGIHGIVVENHEQAVKELEALISTH